MKREEVIYCLKAQSERYSEVCEECPLYGQTGVDHCCEDALQMAITALQNQPVWIPVSERLPEDGTYITTFDGELVGQKEPFTGPCGFEDGKWDEDDCVIAWMPLPEPYRESEVENGK